jgi:hypothetical protein
MRTVTYHCDRCGAEDTTNKIDIVNLGVHVGGYAEKYNSYQYPQTRAELNKEWCAKCRIKAGFKEKPKDSTITQQPVTLEDLVREIAYETACEVINNRA